MGRGFKEVAHLRTDKSKYDENYDRIFGIKSEEKKDEINHDISMNGYESSKVDVEWRHYYRNLVENKSFTSDDLDFLIDKIVEMVDELNKLKGV